MMTIQKPINYILVMNYLVIIEHLIIIKEENSNKHLIILNNKYEN